MTELPAGIEPSVGKPLLRREDIRFVTGRGNYVDDQILPNTAWCAFLRSPIAHAEIRSIGTVAARNMPGVLRVLVGADWEAAGFGRLEVIHPMPFDDGRPMNEAPRPAIAQGRVRHVGDIVAAVIAESRNLAQDAVDAIDVEYEELSSIVDTARALDPDAPLVHPEFGTNLVFEIHRGDRPATLAALEKAPHVVELELPSNRLAASPIEPRSYLCDFEPQTGQFTLWATAQMPHYLRRWLSVYTLGIPEHRLRVISPDVGGGFGSKGLFTVEASTIVWAAQLLQRPVKWTATRSELLLSDSQARDHHSVARMGFDKDGTILALEVDTTAALGGYLSNAAPSIPGNSYPQTITGLYKTPHLSLRVRGVYTNTLPVDAYRGSGRPEATLVNERLIEQGARELGIDVVEIRRRNILSASDFPYPAPGGRVYDSGDPPALFDKLLSIADYEGLRAEQARLRDQGTLMGVGLAAFLDKSGTGPSSNLAKRGGLHGGWESAIARVHSDGKVTLLVGTHSHGQGHEITYAQIAADRLGIPVDDIAVVEGDTDRVPYGNGTWGSRSASVGGAAVFRACELIVDKACRIAAAVLECEEADIEHGAESFTVRGTDRTVSFARIADIANHGAALPPDRSMDPGLEASVFYDPLDNNDPQAIHLVVVIVDRETGVVSVRDYFTADDAGVVINPMIVEGQVHGGLAQGIGQALLEHAVYDSDGQLLSGSFMDYAMPRADELPSYQLTFIETPAPSNPLGVKGGSETGSIGPPAAIGNAVVDALWHLGVRHIQLPLTPNRVWRAIRQAVDTSE